jgi:hypothetical protein
LLAQLTRAIIPPDLNTSMPTPATLFRLLSEFIVLLLGALLILLAVTRPIGLPARPVSMVILGVILMYWGLRALARPAQAAELRLARIRAGSLVLVGVLVLGIRFLPLRDAELQLVLAGGVLVVRGLAAGILLARRR